MSTLSQDTSIIWHDLGGVGTAQLCRTSSHCSLPHSTDNLARERVHKMGSWNTCLPANGTLSGTNLGHVAESGLGALDVSKGNPLCPTGVLSASAKGPPRTASPAEIQSIGLQVREDPPHGPPSFLTPRDGADFLSRALFASALRVARTAHGIPRQPEGDNTVGISQGGARRRRRAPPAEKSSEGRYRE